MRRSDRLHGRIWWVVILLVLLLAVRPDWAPVLFVPVVALVSSYSTLRWREKLASHPATAKRWYAPLFSSWAFPVALVVAQLLVALMPATTLQSVLMLLPLIGFIIQGLTS